MPQTTPRLTRIFPRFSWVLAVAINLFVTLSLVVSKADATVAAIVYLVFIVWFATLTGPTLSIYLAISSSLLFDYFFLAPRRTFRISGFQSWFSMIAFIVSCIVVARVAEQARRQTRKAEQRRADVESLNSLSQEMMLHGDARGLIRDIPRLVEKVFGLEAVLLHVREDDQTYSSIPGNSSPGNAVFDYDRPTDLEGSQSYTAGDYMTADLSFGMKSVGTLAWKPATLSREVATSVAAQVAIAITRAHAIEASAQLEAARSADRLRTALVDSLTHELRTPLTAIRAAATMLVDGRGLDADTSRELISIVDEESLRLDDLIGEAMEMAEMDSDSIRLQPESVQIGGFLEGAIEQMNPQLNSHRVRVMVEDGSSSVVFDQHLIGRVLHHLLENAARYTPQGTSILILCHHLADKVEFVLEDNGPGIDARDLPMIFEKFYRGKQKTVLSRGSGMGLAICRSILTAHGGGITVESVVGKGTTFRFWIPLELKDSPSAQPLPETKAVL